MDVQTLTLFLKAVIIGFILSLTVAMFSACGVGEIDESVFDGDIAVTRSESGDLGANATPEPDSSTDPDSGTLEPDAIRETDSSIEPDSGTPESDASTTDPDSGTPEPDSGTEPNAAPEPDFSTPELDSATPEPDATPSPTSTIDCTNDSDGLQVTIYGPISPALITHPTNPDSIQFGANQVGGVSGAQWSTCYSSSDPRPTIKYTNDDGPYRFTLPTGTNQLNFYLLEAGSGCETHWLDLNPGTAWQVTGDCKIDGTLITVN